MNKTLAIAKTDKGKKDTKEENGADQDPIITKFAPPTSPLGDFSDAAIHHIGVDDRRMACFFSETPTARSSDCTILQAIAFLLQRLESCHATATIDCFVDAARYLAVVKSHVSSFEAKRYADALEAFPIRGLTLSCNQVHSSK